MTHEEVARLSSRVEITGLSKAKADLRSFDTAGGRAARSMDRMAGGMSRSAGRGASAVEAMVSRQKRSLSQLTRVAKIGSLAFAGIATAGVAAGIKLNAQWQSNEAAFATFLGSLQKARKYTEQLRRVSSKSPLRLTEYQEGAKLLLGFGMNAERSLKTLDAINKAVVTMGKSESDMRGIALAIGQIQTKGRVQGQELLQLAERGIPAYRILQEELGLTSEQVRNIGDEGISAEKTIDALNRGLNKMYGEGYKNAQKTFTFQAAQLRKGAEQLLRVGTENIFEDLSEDVLPAVNRELGSIIKIIDNDKLSGGQKLRRLEGRFEQITTKVGDLADDAIPRIGDAVQDAIPMVARHLERLTPIAVNAVGDITKAAVPIAVKGGGQIAIGVVKGFTEADALGKLVVGGWLFHKFGGFAALRAAGTVAGTEVGRGMATGIAAGGAGSAVAAQQLLLANSSGKVGGAHTVPAMAAATMPAPIFDGRQIAASAGAAGKEAAGRFMGTMARALPIMAGTYAVADVVGTAMTQETEPALAKAGATAGGALIGGILGSVVPGIGTIAGAMTGAGVGSVGGGLIAKLFGTERDAETAKQRLQRVSEAATSAAQAQQSALSTVARAGKRVKERQGEAAQAAGRVKKAEDRLLAAREQYGPRSQKALQAEADLTDAKYESARASNRVRNAEKLQGDALERAKTITKDAVLTARERIDAASEDVRTSREQYEQAKKTNAPLKRQAELARDLNSAIGELTDAKKGYRDILAQAAQEIGAKWTRKLKNATDAQIKFGDQGKATAQKIRRPLMSTIFDAGGAVDKLKDKTRQVNRTTSELWPQTANVTGGALDSMIGKYQEAKGAIDGRKAPRSSLGPTPSTQRKRRGGPARRFMGGGEVPVKASPGELMVFPGGDAAMVPGRPVPRDSVDLAVPPGTKFFTGHGQELLASGMSENAALAKQKPHFIKGGQVPKPTISGGPTWGRRTGQAAIDSIHDRANKKLKRLRAQSSFAGLGNLSGSLRKAMALATSMGLTITSTTGGKHAENSWHYKGRAFDAAGSPEAMMTYAKAAAGRWGQRLLELIYSPLGWSIKNGQRVAPYAVADHYDHVHTAMRRGGKVEFRKGGTVRGRVSYFNDGTTASGISAASNAGLALNLNPGTGDAGWNNPTTQGWMQAARKGKPVYAKVTIAGKSAVLPIIDLGPHQSTGRAIDVTQKGLEKMGFTTSNFPTDAIGVVEILGAGAAAAAKKAKEPATKGQKSTIGKLRKNAGGLLGEVRKVAAEYKKQGRGKIGRGGTKAGVKSLRQASKLARAAAKKRKVGDKDSAKKLISKARSQIKKARSALGRARENVFTDPLKPTKLTGLDRRMLGTLPKQQRQAIGQMLRSPGMGFDARMNVAEIAMRVAESTTVGEDASPEELRASQRDDRAVLRWQIKLRQERAKQVRRRINEINNKLGRRNLREKDRKRLLAQRNQLTGTLVNLRTGNIADRQTITGLNEDVQARRDAQPTELDHLQSKLALAGLTEDTGDDRKALEAIEGFWQRQLNAAMASGDPRKVTEAATELASVRDQLKNLTDTTRELIEAQKALADELKRQNDLQQHVMAVTSREATRAMADFLSGQIAGRTRMGAVSGAYNQQVRL